ncbi:MAG: MscL family protein [Nanopusillaceae archaeon]
MNILKDLKNFFQRRENIINVTIAIVLGAAINQVTNFFILDILWPLLKGLMHSFGFNFEGLNQFFPERFLQALAN